MLYFGGNCENYEVKMSDLFEAASKETKEYSAESIEVLEGLEPVRHRPGMYIGGTDETALHHLVAEILDNSMDEAVAGYANKIDVQVNADYSVTIVDNGRGIPVDPHPKYPGKSALEVIMTMLHSGGKFGGGAYKVSGGLHGVGLSVVNALSEKLVVEIARDKKLYRQEYSKGKPVTALELVGNAPNRRGTSVTFRPDPEIFGASANLQPNRIYRMARSKAFLFKGIHITINFFTIYNFISIKSSIVKISFRIQVPYISIANIIVFYFRKHPLSLSIKRDIINDIVGFHLGCNIN